MKKISIHPPSRLSRLLLHIELPLTVLYAVVFLISYLIAAEESPIRAIMYYRPLLSYLLLPVMISAFSVLLVEHLAKET